MTATRFPGRAAKAGAALPGSNVVPASPEATNTPRRLIGRAVSVVRGALPTLADFR